MSKKDEESRQDVADDAGVSGRFSPSNESRAEAEAAAREFEDAVDTPSSNGPFGTPAEGVAPPPPPPSHYGTPSAPLGQPAPPAATAGAYGVAGVPGSPAGYGAPMPPLPGSASPTFPGSPPVPTSYPPAGASYPPAQGGAVPAPPMGPPPVPGSPGTAPMQVPGQVPVAGAPNPFVLSLKNLWDVPLDLWRGRFDEAFNRPAQVTAQTGNTAWNWLAPFLAFPMLLGLWGLAHIQIIYYTGSSFVDEIFWGSVPDLPAAVYLRTFFTVVIIGFAYMMLRTVAIFLAHKTVKSTKTFVASATDLGVAQSLALLPLVVVIIMGFVFPFTSLPFAMLGVSGVWAMVELVTYAGMLRDTTGVRNPLVPYVWYTLIALLITWGLIFMAAVSMGISTFSAFI